MTIFRKVFDSKKSNSVPEYFERVATPDDITTDPALATPSQPLAPTGPASEPLILKDPVSRPLSSKPLTSRPHISERPPSAPSLSESSLSEPRVSEPRARSLGSDQPSADQSGLHQALVSQPVSSRPAVSRPLTSQPVAAQSNAGGVNSERANLERVNATEAGPKTVSGPIFGIGHTEDAPLPPAPPGPGTDDAPEPDLAAMAAEAFGRMQDPAEPPASQPVSQPACQPGDRPHAQSAPISVPRMFGTPEAETPAASHHPQAAGAPRTRLLGFHRSQPIATDPLGDVAPQKVHAESLFPAGWIAITAGPGEGNALPVFGRVCLIGRGEDQDIRLDFGDTSISRDKHAAIAFDDEQRKFYLGHGGKSNLIRLNGRPVLSTEELCHGDTIRIGETTLRFAALCGEEFTWNGTQNDHG